MVCSKEEKCSKFTGRLSGVTPEFCDFYNSLISLVRDQVITNDNLSPRPESSAVQPGIVQTLVVPMTCLLNGLFFKNLKKLIKTVILPYWICYDGWVVVCIFSTFICRPMVAMVPGYSELLMNTSFIDLESNRMVLW